MVTCSRAGINYLADLRTGLQRMLGWLQPGGQLFFNTPQVRYTFDKRCM